MFVHIANHFFSQGSITQHHLLERRGSNVSWPVLETSTDGIDTLPLSTSISWLHISLVQRYLQHGVQVCFDVIRSSRCRCNTDIRILILLVLRAAATCLHLCRLGTVDVCVCMRQWLDDVTNLGQDSSLSKRIQSFFIQQLTAFVRPSRNTIRCPLLMYSGCLMNLNLTLALSPVRKQSLSIVMIDAVCLIEPQCTIA